MPQAGKELDSHITLDLHLSGALARAQTADPVIKSRTRPFSSGETLCCCLVRKNVTGRLWAMVQELSRIFR